MTKSFKEMQGIKEACWVGYKQVGMKKKGDRMVPNCVKEEVVDAVFGKDYVYQENYQDMYKGKLNKNQIATIKNTWAGKKASDVTQGVRDMVKNMDQFTRMDIKKANIKHISALINDEYDFALPLSDLIEMQEFNAAVRHTELKEFTDEQISKLAKSYADLAGKTMSVQNANKLRKLFDRIPDSSLNKLRKKKIPFLSGLALSRMIQKKIPVNESAYNDESAWEVSGVENEGREELQEARWHIEGTMGYKGIGGQDGFEMVINAPNEKVALSVFLVVISVVFSLFTVGYFLRMELPDWQPLSEPGQLWFNTGLLVLSSVLFQWARNIVNSESSKHLTATFIGGGFFAIFFITGQLVIWSNLQDAGYYMTANPANAFYYLMTGVHAVHLLGGLWVWSKSSIKLLSGSEAKNLKLSVELCTLYWHFLLIVWIVLFAILSNT